MSNKSLIRVKFKIQKILFPKNGVVEAGEYSAIGCKLVEQISGDKVILSKWGNFTITCFNSPEFNLYDEYIADIYETNSEKYGRGYNLINLESDYTIESDGSKRAFLEACLTPKQIENLYKIHKDPYELIRNGNTDQLVKCKGIGHKTVQNLFQKYREHIEFAQIYVELKEYNLTKNMIKNLIKTYETAEKVVKQIKEDVYVLVNDISGIGFRKADALALSAGLPKNSPIRLRAFMNYYLEQEAQNGNSWIEPSVLIGALEEGLKTEIDDNNIRNCLYELYDKRIITWDEGKTKISLTKYYNIEKKICEELFRLNNCPSNYKRDNEKEQEIIKNIEEESGFDFTGEQKEVSLKIIEEQVCTLIGFGGCVDCDTEFFNGKQWKKISEWEENDLVLQYEDDGSSKLVTPDKYYKLPCEEMWHFETAALNQTLSDEHRIVYWSTKGVQHECSPIELIEKHKRGLGFTGKFKTAFKYNGKGIKLTDNEIKIMCAVISDGSFNYKVSSNAKTYDRVRFHLKKERKKEALRALLKESNIEWKENKSAAEGYTDFYFYPPAREKEFDSYWYNCNKNQMRVIADNIMQWDGNINYSKINKIKKQKYSTTSKKNADFIQFVFSSLGYRTNLFTQDRSGQEYQACGKTYIRKSIEYSVIPIEKDYACLNYGRAGRTEINKVNTKDGYKYCFSVPSGMLVLRRNNKIFITGNSGKSYLIKLLTTIFKEQNLSVALSCFSGKAAARIFEATGFEGSTIHRLLKYDPRTRDFLYNEDNTLPYDAVIIDECSFIGGDLFLSLIKSIPNGCKLILVGDTGQIPAIGICNVFEDIINANTFYNGRLTQIHRQALKSGIITSSKLVREKTQLFPKGWTGIETRGELQDFTLDIYNERILGVPKLLSYYQEFCKTLEDTPRTQIVLCMKNRGEVNTYEQNKEIQGIFNPPSSDKNEILLSKNDKPYILREGDKVINRKNNYSAEICTLNSFDGFEYKSQIVVDAFGNEEDQRQTTELFNGFDGRVVRIVDGKVIVKFDLLDDLIIFDFEERLNLELSYAITAHLGQGSSWENVIFLMDNSSYIMNNKEILYTAITRARKKCVLLGERTAIENAIKTSATKNKQTFLYDMLRERLF